MAKFKEAEPSAKYAPFEAIRWTATKASPAEGISEIEAYFEFAEPHMYFELIVQYHSEAEREKAARDLLGRPNFRGEWLMPLWDGTALLAWKAWDDKLVYQWLPQGAASAHKDRATPEQIKEMTQQLERLTEDMKKR